MPTSVGQWWQYPLRSPSYRFTQVNNLIRALDARYAQLSRRDMDEWYLYCQRAPWSGRCIPWIFDFDPFDRDGVDGQDSYRGVNASRTLQGVAVSDTPPTQTTDPTPYDLVAVVGPPPAYVWGGTLTPPPGDFCQTIRYAVLNHEPASGPALSKYSYGYTTPVTFGVVTSLSDIFSANSGLISAGAVSVAVSISDRGGAPMLASRLVYSPPYI